MRPVRGIALCLALAAATTSAQDYPTHPIRLIMPNAPGSSIDTLGRLLGVRLGEALGQTIVIENRAGAAGAIGIETAKSAAPDGYTLLFASASGMSAAPLLQKKIPYDPLNDFAFVSLVAVMPNVLAVNPALPIYSVKDLIDYSRANKGKVNMASAGPGAVSHLGGVLLMVMGDFESVHVPYKGGGPSVASVVAGESHWTIAPAPSTMSLVKSGRLRAIGHTMPQRAPLFGDMPAIAETLPGYDYSGWAGLLAPKATPKAIVDRLQAALANVAANPALKEGFAAQGADVVVTSPEEFRRFLEQDIANTARVVKAAGLQPE
ncbi:MAG TPA: tripartite tricarboxylate transporter substrate-binding protein [Burkholderiales bacterium]|nr:tripartite tricarboxylate transporter substrate-binding protein [Burkholderiales bacterium]